MHDEDIQQHKLPDEVKINLNELGVLVLYGVGGHVHDADVGSRPTKRAEVDCGARGEAVAARLCLQPISHGVILCFCTGPGDCSDASTTKKQVVVKEHHIT